VRQLGRVSVSSVSSVALRLFVGLTLAFVAAGCHGRRTLLFLQLQAGPGAPADVRAIDVQFTLAGRTASVKLREKSGTAIAFPTGDIIDIGAGAGALTALAIARDAGGSELARASGSATIAAGESSALTLVFGSVSDGGVPSDDLTGAPDDLGAVDLGSAAPDLADAAPPGPDLSAPVDLGGATVPGSPTNVLASPLVLSAKVSWTAPASNGGAAIVAYTVTSSPDGVQAVAYPPSTGVTIYGLRQGGSYTFTVTATNGVGTGPASLPSAPAVMPTNLALHATVTVSSTYSSGSDVYDKAHVNDGNVDTRLDGSVSWTNADPSIYPGVLPATLQLDFGATYTPTVVHLYSSQLYPIMSFKIEVGNGAVWNLAADITTNTSVYQSIPLTPFAGTSLRLTGRSGQTGPSGQPGYVRINELEVY
jgi:hypothetical protein